MDRRHFLAHAGQAATAAAAVAAGLPLSGSAFADRSGTGLPAKKGKPSLTGPYLDLTTAHGSMMAMARLEGDLDPKKSKYGWASGVLFGVVPNEKVRDLMGVKVFSSTRVLQQADGSFQRLSREVVYYTDIKTGAFLEVYDNPYTNEQVKVVTIANDPFNYKIEEFYPAPPSYGGLNKDAPPRRPFLLDWTVKGDMLNLFQYINLFYPSALQPDKWPRESPGKMSQVSEIFLYIISLADMQDARKTSVNYTGSWSRITPWLPWMLMGQAPGHCSYECQMGATDSLDDIDPQLIAHVREKNPTYLSAPETWVEPSLSSLEHYALEQKPAPAKP
jgi:hypothetical protein